MGSDRSDTTAPPQRAPAGRWRRRSASPRSRSAPPGRWRSRRSTSSTRGSRAPRTRRRRSAPRSSRTSAELAAAQQQAIVAAQREAQLTAVLEQGRAREAQLEADRRPRRGGARRRSRAARPLAQRALQPAGRDLPRRDAGRDHAPARVRRLRRPRRPAPSTCAGSRRPTRRSSAACAALRDRVSAQARRGRARPRQRAEAVQRPDRGRPRPDRRRPRRRRGAGRAARRPARRAPGRGRDRCSRRSAAGPTRSSGSSGSPPARPQGEVSEWFGDWAIPESIVMCESGGNFEAVNPTSGAGGAYQILPSTWELYGGEGHPAGRLARGAGGDRRPDLGRLGRRRLGLRRLALGRLALRDQVADRRAPAPRARRRRS